MMELDRGWVYKHLDEKPALACPCCGKTHLTLYTDSDCYCAGCNSEWIEKDGMWSCVQAAGLIK